MTIRLLPRPVVLVITLALGLGLRLSAADPGPAQKPGYTVVLDISMDESGVPQDVKVVSSDDLSVEHILEQISLEKAHRMKMEPRMKDGHPVKFTVRAPFTFPVQGDEGPDSNLAPKPSLHGKIEAQPVYPADLAAKGETGGAILEVIVSAEGTVRDVSVLRTSNHEFGASAVAAVKQWEFSPAMKNGVAVSSRWRLAIVFQTDVREPDWEWRVPPRPALGSYIVMHRTRPLPAPAAAPAVPPTGPAPSK